MSSPSPVTETFSFYKHVTEDERWFCAVLLGRSFQSPGTANVADTTRQLKMFSATSFPLPPKHSLLSMHCTYVASALRAEPFGDLTGKRPSHAGYSGAFFKRHYFWRLFFFFFL